MGRFAGLAMCPAEAKLLFCNSFPQFVGQFSGSVVQLLLWVSFDPNTDGEEKIGIISFQEFFSLPVPMVISQVPGKGGVWETNVAHSGILGSASFCFTQNSLQ